MKRMQKILKYLANQENRTNINFYMLQKENVEILEKEKIDYNKIAL